MVSARTATLSLLALALVTTDGQAGDISFTGSANPPCFREGDEGTVTIVAKNTLGQTLDALVVAACAKFDGSTERPSWIVGETVQNPTDKLKLPSVFLYEFNDQNCIRAQPAAPGGEWPANATTTVTFTYRVPETVAVPSP